MYSLTKLERQLSAWLIVLNVLQIRCAKFVYKVIFGIPYCRHVKHVLQVVLTLVVNVFPHIHGTFIKLNYKEIEF